MNVSGQIMLNATYMHNQMTYLWQYPQITVCKCTFIILQLRLVKRRTKLADPKVQQVCSKSAQCVMAGSVPWDLGTEFLGCDGRQSSWEAAPGTILLALYCWTLQALPACSLPGEVDYRHQKFNYAQGIPVWVLLLALHCLPKERGTSSPSQHWRSHLIQSALPFSWHWLCCECWICNAEIPAVRTSFFPDKFSGKIQSCSMFCMQPLHPSSHLQGWFKQ